MYQIVYLSRAKENFDPESSNGVSQILSRANELNKNLGLTGMLIYRQSYFMQLLEGDIDRIYYLMGKITLDKRHGGIHVLFQQEAKSRLFPHWSMAYIKNQSKEFEESVNKIFLDPIIDKYKSGKEIDNDEIRAFLKAFRFKLNLEKDIEAAA